MTEIVPNAVRDHSGAWHQCDLVLAGRRVHRDGLLATSPAWPATGTPVRLQMMQTAPMAERLTTAVADGDSLRYYPAYS